MRHDNPNLDLAYDELDEWTKLQRRNWAIYVYTLNATSLWIAEQLKTDERTVKEFLQRIVRGEDPGIYFIPRPLLEGQRWTTRTDFIIRKCREYGRTLADTALLLHREQDSVKARWKEIKDSNG